VAQMWADSNNSAIEMRKRLLGMGTEEGDEADKAGTSTVRHVEGWQPKFCRM